MRLPIVRLFAMLLLATVLAASVGPALPVAAPVHVLKATLRNGLQVVIVRNTLAPVASTDLVYLVGSRDDPEGVPGMAHAQEHMMFRGTRNLSTSELGTVATSLGGNFNAETSDTLTQFQFTVPAADLDAVFRIESDRMRDVLDDDAQWRNERGAIEQEVLRDQSEPGADFFDDVTRLAYAGTPYGHDGVGTIAAFNRLTGPQLKAFYSRWYAPNNAVLVVAGDVDQQRTLAQIRNWFEAIPRKPVPAHAVAHLAPLKRTVLRQPTKLVYPLAALAFRLPGVDSPDFLPSFVLQSILGSERGPLRALVDSGEALDGSWTPLPYVPEAQVGLALAALRPGADPMQAARKLEAIVTAYRKNGVPEELFVAQKRQLIADQELSRNSISALASDWATTIALDREPSIAEEQALISKVSLAEVNRAARTYLDVDHAIVGALEPSAGADEAAEAQPPGGGSEKPLAPQPPVTHLPAWANALVTNLSVPPPTGTPVETRLTNGITLIVQPETISDSVFVFGSVKAQPALQEPPGKEGVASVLDAQFAYGTRTQDRIRFQRAQDDIDSEVAGGFRFGAQTTSASFERAIDLVGQSQLQPRFDEPTFEQARRQSIDQLATALNSTGTQLERRAAAALLPAGDPALREPTTASLQALSLDDVRAHYQKTFRPDLTTIVVVGNMTPEKARVAIERVFGGWHESGPASQLDLPEVPLNPPGDVKITLADGQSEAEFRQIVPLLRTAPQAYPLVVGNTILGGGSLGPEQSRLFRDLRQNAGLVYSVKSQLAAQRKDYEFDVLFSCSPGNLDRISSLIDAEIERMKDEPLGSFELSLAKASLVRQATIGDASLSAIGERLLSAAEDGEPFDQSRIDAQHLLEVDAHAIQDAFGQYIKPQNFVRVVQGP
ncbi:MAG: M16 family metallopeptidase [Vulcanimicrobiaceae bacterium]